MPKKKLGKGGRSFASFPAEIYKLDDQPEKLPDALKKIEAQVRQTAKYDHDEMRRADAARLLAYFRVLGIKWLSSMCHFLDNADDKSRGEMLKYVGNLLYNDNRQRMDELLDLTAEDFAKAEGSGTPVKTVHDRLKEKMGNIGGLKPENMPEEALDADQQPKD